MDVRGPGKEPIKKPESKIPEKKIEPSRELRNVKDKIVHVIRGFYVSKNQAKLAGYSKEPANKNQDDKITSVEKNILS